MLDVPSTRYMERGKERAERKPPQEQRQVVLVFQGGGALGAYQAGVYQALHESGIEPDWIIGTSIGAFNASLIAGKRARQSRGAAGRILAADVPQGVLGLAWARRHDVVLVDAARRHPWILRA